MPIPTDVHERIRAMEAVEQVQGLSELDPDRIERAPRRWADPVRAGVSYFRIPDPRMARGRITLLENGQNATERVMYRDYVMLRQYGGYHGANHPADWQRTDVYLAIIHAGGLHEFDAEQILDMWWHIRPGRDASRSHRLIWDQIDRLIGQGIDERDAILTVMPQLEGHDLTPAVCEACPGRPFRDAEAVRSHRSAMHKEDVQTMGTRDAIAMALQSGSGGGGGLDKLADAMTALIAQNQQLMELLAGQQVPRRGRPPKPTDDDATE